jgi:hypothetical protein
MNEFNKALLYFSQAHSTLEVLSNFIGFYRSLNEEIALKISDFVSKLQISEQNKIIKLAMDTLIQCAKDRISFHLDISQ